MPGFPQKRFYTVEEYYALERAAHHKSDYYKGEIFDMSGGTIRHSRISANVNGALWSRLRDKPCASFESNLRVCIRPSGLRCYPDATVICGPIEYDEDDAARETITNPTAVFEVLSPSTEAYDRGVKGEGYRTVESLQAHLMISQSRPHVELFERQPDGRWLLTDFTGREAVIALPALGIQLPLSEIYDRVEFDPEPMAG